MKWPKNCIQYQRVKLQEMMIREKIEKIKREIEKPKQEKEENEK